MIIDTNTYLSRWPFRRLAGDETPDFVARLRQRDVGQTWAGSFDGILHKDIAGVNARLAADCRMYGDNFLIPFGTINPTLPGWREDLARCRAEHHMPGIRVHPNYHGYALADPVFAELLHLAAQQRLIVQVAVCMEDVRTQNRLVSVPPVDLSALAPILRREPAARLQLLNWQPGTGDRLQLQQLVNTGSAYFDIAMAEGIQGIAGLVRELSADKVVFGSHFPLFYFESALLKMQESGLSGEQQRAVFEGNAARLLGTRVRL